MVLHCMLNFRPSELLHGTMLNFRPSELLHGTMLNFRPSELWFSELALEMIQYLVCRFIGYVGLQICFPNECL
jgi:hypothetical protein